jgi:mono/diheme cytochrome c family protein
VRWLALSPLGFVALGCHTDLWIQPKTRTMAPAVLFPNGPPQPPPGVVAVSSVSPEVGSSVPVAATARTLKVPGLAGILARGRERFDIFCSPCHGRIGDGNGMIAERGFALTRRPRNLHIDRIQRSKDGYIFEVITHGYGAMMGYDDRIPPADRWAIVAYVRALELSEEGGS